MAEPISRDEIHFLCQQSVMLVEALAEALPTALKETYIFGRLDTKDKGVKAEFQRMTRVNQLLQQQSNINMFVKFGQKLEGETDVDAKERQEQFMHTVMLMQKVTKMIVRMSSTELAMIINIGQRLMNGKLDPINVSEILREEMDAYDKLFPYHTVNKGKDLETKTR